MVIFDKEKEIILEGETTSKWVEMVRRNKMSEINKNKAPIAANFARDLANENTQKDMDDQIERINASILKAATRGEFKVPAIVPKSAFKKIKAKYEEYGYTIVKQSSCWYDMTVLEIRWDGKIDDSGDI